MMPAHLTSVTSLAVRLAGGGMTGLALRFASIPDAQEEGRRDRGERLQSHHSVPEPAVHAGNREPLLTYLLSLQRRSPPCATREFETLRLLATRLGN